MFILFSDLCEMCYYATTKGYNSKRNKCLNIQWIATGRYHYNLNTALVMLKHAHVVLDTGIPFKHGRNRVGMTCLWYFVSIASPSDWYTRAFSSVLARDKERNPSLSRDKFFLNFRRLHGPERILHSEIG